MGRDPHATGARAPSKDTVGPAGRGRPTEPQLPRDRGPGERGVGPVGRRRGASWASNVEELIGGGLGVAGKQKALKLHSGQPAADQIISFHFISFISWEFGRRGRDPAGAMLWGEGLERPR